MTCEKCNSISGMQATSVFRLSGCLAAVGFVILVPSLIVMLLAIGFAVFGMVGTGALSVGGRQVAIERAAIALSNAVPTLLLDEFRQTGNLRTNFVSGLTYTERENVDEIMERYVAGVRNMRTGAGGAALLLGGMSVVPIALGLVGTIVGLLLLLRKKIWRCHLCGFTTHRD